MWIFACFLDLNVFLVFRQQTKYYYIHWDLWELWCTNTIWWYESRHPTPNPHLGIWQLCLFGNPALVKAATQRNASHNVPPAAQFRVFTPQRSCCLSQRTRVHYRSPPVVCCGCRFAASSAVVHNQPQTCWEERRSNTLQSKMETKRRQETESEESELSEVSSAHWGDRKMKRIVNYSLFLLYKKFTSRLKIK